jgi:hypothetical protein
MAGMLPPYHPALPGHGDHEGTMNIELKIQPDIASWRAA